MPELRYSPSGPFSPSQVTSPLPPAITTELIQAPAPGNVATFTPYLGDYLYSVSFLCGLLNTAPYTNAPIEMTFGVEPDAGTFATIYLPGPIAPGLSDPYWTTISGQFRFNAVDASPVSIVSLLSSRNVNPHPEIQQWVTSGAGSLVAINPIRKY